MFRVFAFNDPIHYRIYDCTWPQRTATDGETHIASPKPGIPKTKTRQYCIPTARLLLHVICVPKNGNINTTKHTHAKYNSRENRRNKNVLLIDCYVTALQTRPSFNNHNHNNSLPVLVRWRARVVVDANQKLSGTRKITTNNV